MRYRQSIKGASLLSAAEAVNQGCSFLRNVILSHFLTKADFGVAAMLAMVLTLLETTSKLALGQQVVQSTRGDDPEFVDAVQLAQIGAGALSAVMIVILAWPAAHFLSAPRYMGSILALALIPACNGLANLDLYRRARRLGFERLVIADSVPNIVTALAAWPVARLFPDYHAVLYLLLSKAILASALTHVLADRRFHPIWHPAWLKESLRFGWPLLLSGFIQFGNFQGESMVVAAAYSLSSLGEFSVATTMAMTPAFAFMRVSQSLSLPLLAEVQNDPARLIRRYAVYAEAVAFAACVATLGMIFVGEYFVVLFFGAKYAGVGVLASWLIAGQALRVVRGATVSAAMARGDTMNMMLCSSWRLAALPLSIAAGFWHGSLTWFAVTGFTGEVAALTVSVLRLRRRQGIPLAVTLAPVAAGIGCIAVAVAIRQAFGLLPRSPLNVAFLAGALVLSVGVYLAVFPLLRSVVSAGLQHRRMPAGIGSPAR